MNRVMRGLAVASALAALGGCSLFGTDKSSIDTGGGGGKEQGSLVEPQKQDNGKIAEAALVGFDTIYFDYDKTSLRAEALPVLKHLAEWMQQHPDVRLRIAGHADERGTREYNLALGERRATTVRSYLAAQGVAGERLDTVSYGKERPAMAGSNEESWAKNRRAVAEVE
jgi:peptidoglycan-associated lipoprotein